MKACLLIFALVASAVHAGEEIFLDSVISLTEDTVTLPAYVGRLPNGESFWYIITEASEGEAADRLGVARSDKLNNAKGTSAVQDGYHDDDGILVVGAGVDFSPQLIVNPTPGTGFPPAAGTQPGSIGEPGYTPLVQLPDGTILNAPHIARASQPADIHDSVVALDKVGGTATIAFTTGFARDKPVTYISTEASAAGPAALEASTYAPALNAAPRSSRAPLVAFTNGQTGINNPDRQGLNSALLGEGAPLNLLDYLSNQGNYSPLWDVFLTAWADPDQAELVTRVADVEDLAEDGEVTAPDGSSWGPSDFIVNCPIIARLD